MKIKIFYSLKHGLNLLLHSSGTESSKKKPVAWHSIAMHEHGNNSTHVLSLQGATIGFIRLGRQSLHISRTGLQPLFPPAQRAGKLA